MIYHFTAHTINCVCHSIRSMLRVLGMYNFGSAIPTGIQNHNFFSLVLLSNILTFVSNNHLWKSTGSHKVYSPASVGHSTGRLLVLYMSFDKFLLAVESRDLSQADKSILRVSSFPKLFLNDKIYSYTKKNIWHLAIWQN